MKRLFLLLQYILPHHLLSRLVGRFAASRNRALRRFLISRFIRTYEVNMNEALNSDIDAYDSFNDFFTRALAPAVRPIAEQPDAIVCPADGTISAIGRIRDGQLLQAKGHTFSLLELLGGDAETAARFQEGSFATVYLSPRDYHRVHMPFSGTLERMVFVPGRIFSVNQTTADNVPNLFARNERVICLFQTDIGPMAVILVGAMIVASIETVWAGVVAPNGGRTHRVTDYSREPPIHIEKGLELGRFKLGSTAIVLFGAGVMQWTETFTAGEQVRLGQSLGSTL